MHNEKTTIFIDGSSGTAGLRIYDRLAQRADIDLLTLPPELHHDIEAQRELLNRADIAFLCLPDAAAITAADLVENPDTVVLDTSTAHRTAPGWTYGFPELSPEREAAIRTAKRIAVPGCHASGFIVLVYPLVEAGILPPDALLTCYSLTGYSGGGKKMIAEYEADELDPLYVAPRQYGLAQQHKHLREMCAIPGLTHAPVFAPIVANFYSGMETSVALFASQLCPGKTAEDIAATLNLFSDDRPWKPQRIDYILTNERYSGNALLRKRYATDTIPRKVKRNRGERPMYFVAGINEAVVSQEIFDKAQELRKKRWENRLVAPDIFISRQNELAEQLRAAKL